MRDEMSATLRIYKWPSQAFWRYLEVRALVNPEMSKEPAYATVVIASKA